MGWDEYVFADETHMGMGRYRENRVARNKPNRFYVFVPVNMLMFSIVDVHLCTNPSQFSALKFILVILFLMGIPNPHTILIPHPHFHADIPLDSWYESLFVIVQSHISSRMGCCHFLWKALWSPSSSPSTSGRLLGSPGWWWLTQPTGGLSNQKTSWEIDHWSSTVLAQNYYQLQVALWNV